MTNSQELQTKLARAEEQLALANERYSKLEAQIANKVPAQPEPPKQEVKEVAETKEEVKPEPIKEEKPDNMGKLNKLDFDKASKKMIQEAEAESKKENKSAPNPAKTEEKKEQPKPAKAEEEKASEKEEPKASAKPSPMSDRMSALANKKNNLMSSIQKLNSIKKKSE
jgi:hypothetical protein